MVLQVFRSSKVNMDGRWWVGIKRWPSRETARKLPGWSMPRPWFIGVGPVQVRIWPGISRQTADMLLPTKSTATSKEPT